MSLLFVESRCTMWRRPFASSNARHTGAAPQDGIVFTMLDHDPFRVERMSCSGPGVPHGVAVYTIVGTPAGERTVSLRAPHKFQKLLELAVHPDPLNGSEMLLAPQLPPESSRPFSAQAGASTHTCMPKAPRMSCEVA